MATLYSECASLVVNCRLCIDPGLLIPASAAFFSNGASCYETDFDGKITTIGPCVVPCDLVMTNVTTTDPTTLGGTDGTITANFTTSHGPTTYSLNGVDQGVAFNPLVITGLSANTTYTIIITDSNGCTVQASPTLGQSATLFDADWIMITYQFQSPGRDLDTRTRIALPNIGQDSQAKYLGWSRLAQYPATNPPVLAWGGDNTGTGFESILVNVARFKVLYPGETQFTVDLRCFWFGTPTTIPVIAAVTLWKGGTPIQDGCVVDRPDPQEDSYYCWTNPTAQFTGTIDSVPLTISLATQDSNTSGQRLATLSYRLDTLVAVLNNNDTTTPSV